MRIEWKSERLGVARCPADFKVLGEGEPTGTFEAYVAVFSTPDRPDFFGDSDVIEPGAFTQSLPGLRQRLVRIAEGPFHCAQVARRGRALGTLQQPQEPCSRACRQFRVPFRPGESIFKFAHGPPFHCMAGILYATLRSSSRRARTRHLLSRFTVSAVLPARKSPLARLARRLPGRRQRPGRRRPAPRRPDRGRRGYRAVRRDVHRLRPRELAPTRRDDIEALAVSRRYGMFVMWRDIAAEAQARGEPATIVNAAKARADASWLALKESLNSGSKST